MADRPPLTSESRSQSERDRLTALDRYAILDTNPEAAFDELVELASQIAGTPISLVSLVDEARQWFKARKGLDVTETPRSVAFCAHAIGQSDIFEVLDASSDPRFASNPLVTGNPELRFYAGIPLTTPDGFALGTLCVLDRVPHPPLSDQQRSALRIVARQVMAQMELRRLLAGQQITQEELTSENRFLQDKVVEQTGELRVNAEVLKQSQKMEALGQLTGGIAHDFNNLLQGIVGSVAASRQLIKKGRIDEVDRFLGMATNAAQRAASLTGRLLAFARSQPMIPENVDVEKQLGSLLDIMKRICGEAIELTLQKAQPLWPVRCDPNELENAVLNLVINARDAMPQAGLLTIRYSNEVLAESPSSSHPGDYVLIGVSDNGSGMAPETVQRAFDAFFTTKGPGRGTGLGLSMVATFARQAGGFASIESEPGRGTTVKIHLPRSDQADNPAPANVARKRSFDLSDVHVAVVEDDSVVRSLMVSLLREAGCRVFEAPDGAAGLRVLESMERIDLLIADLGLPGLNGKSLAALAVSLRPKVRTLLISGYGSSSHSQDAEVMSKPFAMEDFLQRVEQLVGRPC